MPDNEETTRIPDGSSEDTTWLGQWEQAHQETAETEETDERPRGTHPLQVGYLVVGLLAVGVALMWLLTEQGVVDGGDGGVAFSVVLITAGAVGLAASLGKGLRRQ